VEVLDVGSSLTSNRLDMAPLCHVDVAVDAPARVTGSDVGIEGPLPLPMYIAAFPFPGRDEGRRFTMTEDERGIIVESSLNSGGARHLSDPARQKASPGDSPCLDVAS